MRREKYLFTERDYNKMIILMHNSRARWCKRQANKNGRKHALADQNTNN